MRELGNQLQRKWENEHREDLSENDIGGRRGAEVAADDLKNDAAREDCFGQITSSGVTV